MLIFRTEEQVGDRQWGETERVGVTEHSPINHPRLTSHSFRKAPLAISVLNTVRICCVCVCLFCSFCRKKDRKAAHSLFSYVKFCTLETSKVISVIPRRPFFVSLSHLTEADTCVDESFLRATHTFLHTHTHTIFTHSQVCHRDGSVTSQEGHQQPNSPCFPHADATNNLAELGNALLGPTPSSTLPAPPPPPSLSPCHRNVTTLFHKKDWQPASPHNRLLQ